MVDRINGVASKTPGIAHRFVTATPGTLLLALAVAIIYAAPLLHLILAGTSVAPAFNENIGYRYFYILRAIENPVDFTHPIQGTLTGVIQQAIYLALRLVDPAPQNALVEKTNLFALATSLSATVILALVLIAVARSRAIDFPSKLALFALPLIYEYGSYYGLWFTLLPDYYVLQEPLLIFMAFVSLVLAQSALTERRMVKLVALSGAIMGLLAGLKVTYGVTPVLMLGASIFAASRHRLRDFAILTAACGATCALCLLVYYHGNVSYAVRFVVLLYYWMPGLTGSSSFAAELLNLAHPWFGSGSYVPIWMMSGFCLVAIAGALFRHPHGARNPIVWAGLTAIAINLYFVLRRGAATSAIDFYLAVPTVALILISRLRPSRDANGMLAVFGVGALALAALWTIKSFPLVRDNAGMISIMAEADKRAGGLWNQRVYDWNRSHGLPIVTLIPNNFFGVGTIEDMMARGLAPLPAPPPFDANENPTRERFFPQYWFVDYRSTRHDGIDIGMGRKMPMPKRYVFMWMAPLDPHSWAGDLASAQAEHEYLEREGYLALLGTGRCRTWQIIFGGIAVHSCVVTDASQ